ncbi:MAG: ergothioneine biosynthesis protein EgtB [Pyrinomonadaceae bacterium]
MQAFGKSENGSTDLLTAFKNVRSYTEKLCEPLEIEDYIPQPIVDVSPAKWNIAHTTWFFEEMVLKQFVPGYKVFDERFGFLFNSYYNTIGDRAPRDNRGALSRPTVSEVFAYRKYVDEAMAKLLASSASSIVPPVHAGGSDLAELVTLGLNHEQQHQELFLTDLKYTLSINPLFPAYREGFAPEENIESGGGGFVELGEGVFEIGFDGDSFCFDNELSRHKVYLNDFALSDRLVTNAEFIEFIDAGGYTDFRFWHSEGWDWVNREAVRSPLYWNKIDGEWNHFTLGGLRPLPLDAPVCHVSFYEASAFAEWKGIRLPTEFEWEVANDRFDWGKRWEWTNSAYLPYPGFAKAAGAVGEYNGKFMINQMVLRGASVATPVGHSRPTYRNFFHPHLRWQFTGIRLAK